MKQAIEPIQAINIHEFAKKGEEIYQSELKEKLEKKYKDQYVAIDIDSHEYFMGKTQMEANEKAKKKYPSKVFYMVRIGYPAVITMSHSFAPPAYGSFF